jgi:RNA polymerase sigma factor FliA
MRALESMDSGFETDDRGSWQRFVDDPTPEHREILVQRYLKLLYRNASTLSRRIPLLESEEAISSGFIGLSQAIDRFEPSRGLSFTTFAFPRIRGAVLDEVRRQSPLTRPVNDKLRKIERARRTIAARELRRPEDSDIARELGVSLEEYWSWRDDGHRRKDVSLDQPTERVATGAALPVGDITPDPTALDFLASVERESTGELVRRAVADLPARERLAIEAHFFQDKTYREVGALLKVSGVRAYEIVKRGLTLLRKKLTDLAGASFEVPQGV